MMDQAKMLMQVKKLQKELAKTVLEVASEDDFVTVQITGEQKIKKISIDPEQVDTDNIGELEETLQEVIKQAIQESQQLAAEKMKPMMGKLGDLGL